MIKILNLKFVILFEYQNIKSCFKGYVSNWTEEVFVIKKKLKTLCHGHMLSVMLKAKKLLERFTKKSCWKQIKKSFELKK